MQRNLAGAGMAIGLCALGVEFWLQLAQTYARGGSFAGAAARYVSYYTIISNALAVLVYAAFLHPTPMLNRLRSARVRAMTGAMMLVVALVYLLLLSRVENPQGLAKLSAVAAHYVTVPIYLAWWTLVPRREPLTMWDIPLMLAPSFAYMAYVLVRGWITHEYPYAMLNVDRLSEASVTLNGLGMLLALVASCAAFIAADHALRARRISTR